jgi:DHA2 family multidrug resistance protein
MAGLMMAPRGIGVIITSQITSWLLAARFDYRWIITTGYVIAAYSIWRMTQWSIDMSWGPIIEASFIQGLGLGMVFAPMNLVAFSTIAPELRPDGSSLLALFRNMGGSIGISAIVTMLARNTQMSHEDLSSHVTGAVMGGIHLPPDVGLFPQLGPMLVSMLDSEVGRQAAMIAYLDNFYVLTFVVLALAPVPFLLKRPKTMVAARDQTLME